MKKARVTTEFPGRPEGEALSRTITVGEEISGELAEVAIKQKWATEIDVAADKAVADKAAADKAAAEQAAAKAAASKTSK